MKNRNWKPLLLIAGATLLAGAFSTFLSGDSRESYRLLRKPLLAPRAIVFPIVWTLLYLLMSISAWLIYETRQRGKHNALKFYVGQLAVNLLWPLLFFGMKLYLFSFLWLLFLLLLVILMIFRFYQLSAAAALLQIPYVLWLIFAGYLNFSFYLLNR